MYVLRSASLNLEYDILLHSYLANYQISITISISHEWNWNATCTNIFCAKKPSLVTRARGMYGAQTSATELRKEVMGNSVDVE